MKNSVRLLIASIEALIVLAVIYFEPSYCIRGMLWREAFFDGKPTSWWRAELERWEVNKEPGISWMGYRETAFHRNPTRIEAFRERWFPNVHQPPVPEGAMEQVMAVLAEQQEIRQRRPSLLHGDKNAIPVLQALLDDPSPKLRLFAQIGLGMKPKIAGDE